MHGKMGKIIAAEADEGQSEASTTVEGWQRTAVGHSNLLPVIHPE